MNKLGAAEGLISKVQTTVDGGLRVTIDFSSADLDLVKKLLEVASSSEKQVTVAFVKPGPTIDVPDIKF